MDKLEIIKLLLLVTWPVVLLAAYVFYNKYVSEKKELNKVKESIKPPEFNVDTETKEVLQKLAGVKSETNSNKTFKDTMFEYEMMMVVTYALKTYDMFDVDATGTQIEATFDRNYKHDNSIIKDCVIKAEYDNDIMKVLTRVKFSSEEDAEKFIEKFKETKQNEFAIITGERDNAIFGTKGKKYVVVSRSSDDKEIVVCVSILYSMKIDKSNSSAFAINFPRNYYDAVIKHIRNN